MDSLIGFLDNKIRSAGIPIGGISGRNDGGFDIDFLLEATQEQRDLGAGIAANFKEIEFEKYLSLEKLITWRDKQRGGISEADYHEAAGWLADQNTFTWLSKQAGKLHQTTLDYANSIIATWGAAENAYDLAVSLVEQAKTVDDIKLILSRRL